MHRLCSKYHRHHIQMEFSEKYESHLNHLRMVILSHFNIHQKNCLKIIISATPDFSRFTHQFSFYRKFSLFQLNQVQSP